MLHLYVIKPLSVQLRPTSNLTTGSPQPLIILSTISGSMWCPACCLGYRLLQKFKPISDAKIVHRFARSIQSIIFPQGGSVDLEWIHGHKKHLLLPKNKVPFSSLVSHHPPARNLLWSSTLIRSLFFFFFTGLIIDSLPACDPFWSPPLSLGFGWQVNFT